MSLPTPLKTRPAALVALTLALAAPAGALATGGAHRSTEPLVVRGTDSVVDGACSAGGCELELQGGAFHGTPVGNGAYDGAMRIQVSRAFQNGEGGVCAPVRGRVTLGAGSADRLVLAVAGDSCQDGRGDPGTAAFTGLARFTVKYGTGAYAGASGSGIAVFAEGTDDHERMTLIGRLRH